MILRIFSVSLLLVAFNCFSQKVDLDRAYLPVKYISLPTSNALNQAQTYTVALYSQPAVLAELQLKDSDLETAFVMIGYSYKKTKDADFLEEVTIDRMKIISQSIESYKVDLKNAEGVVTSTVTYYYILSNVVAPTYIKVINNLTGSELEYLGIANTNAPITFKSADFKSHNDAAAYAAKSLITDRSNFFIKTYKEKFYAAFTSLHKKYCYGFQDEKDLFWNVDLKKNPEFADFNEELNKTKAVFETMNFSESVVPLREKLAPTLGYWSEKAATINAEDKKTRKLKYAYLINLATTQYWLEMFDECSATCNAIVLNDYDKGDGKAMLVAIDNVKKSLQQHGLTSRHFDRPGFSSVESFKVAGNIQKLESEASAIIVQEEVAPKGYTVLPGYLIDFEKNKVEGELWVKNLDNSESFMPANNTVFVYKTPLGQKKMTVSADNIDKIVLGRTAIFETILYKNSIGLTEKHQLFRVMYENEKIKVMKLYNTTNSNSLSSLKSDLKQIWSGSELCLMKKSDGIIQPVSGASDLKTKENVMEFYKFCDELQLRIKLNEIKDVHTMAGQKAAADFYAENCK